MSNENVRHLILGTGDMARQHVQAFQAMENVTVVAGIDRDTDRLTTFCDDYGIDHRFTTIEEAIAWGGFDSISNVTPDAAHYATTLMFLTAGKHVLCEKPLALSYGDAKGMAEAANAAGVVNMINLTYRAGRAMQKASRLVASGAIGTVRHFDASYLQSWLVQPAWGEWRDQETWLWRLSSAHGSKGVLGDVGVHLLDFATYISGSSVASLSCRLKTFDKAPSNQIGDFVLDANDSCVMHLELEDGATGVLHASRFASGHLNDLSMNIYGDKGALKVMATQTSETLQGCLGENLLTAQWEDLEISDKEPWIYDRFIAAICGNGTMDPDFEWGAKLQKILDLASNSVSESGLSMNVF